MFHVIKVNLTVCCLSQAFELCHILRGIIYYNLSTRGDGKYKVVQI